MNGEIEGTISILTALLVLFTAMLYPGLAVGQAVYAIATLGTHEFARSRRQLDSKET